jgi:biotin transport system substrate-specific component
MLRTLPQTRDQRLTIRIAEIAFFTALTVVCAKITIPLQPVPFTMQTFAVLLAGMVLGTRDGMLSQILYLVLVAIGLPFDAFGRGSAALFGPTGGYLVGFVAAAAAVGWLTERGEKRLWQRWVAGIIGAAVIHFFGVPVLALSRGTDLMAAAAVGTIPFIIPDLAKALLAAALTEGGRRLLLRQNVK